MMGSLAVSSLACLICTMYILKTFIVNRITVDCPKYITDSEVTLQTVIAREEVFTYLAHFFWD